MGVRKGATRGDQKMRRQSVIGETLTPLDTTMSTRDPSRRPPVRLS